MSIAVSNGMVLRARIELTADDLREIDTAASKITVEGNRYPEHLEKDDRPLAIRLKGAFDRNVAVAGEAPSRRRLGLYRSNRGVRKISH